MKKHHNQWNGKEWKGCLWYYGVSSNLGLGKGLTAHLHCKSLALKLWFIKKEIPWLDLELANTTAQNTLMLLCSTLWFTDR